MSSDSQVRRPRKIGWRVLAPLAVLLAWSAAAMAQPSCPPDSMVSQLPIPPDATWWFGNSDAAGGYLRYESYSVDQDVCDVHWWGITPYWSGAGWEPCDENPMTFEITFYPDAGGQPGAPACTYVYTVIGVPGDIYGDAWQLYEYSVDLDPCCPLRDGWISIQGVSVSDPDCWFLWAGSDMGDGSSWVTDHTVEPPVSGPEVHDLALCLTPPEIHEDRMVLDGPDFPPFQPITDPRGPWHELWPMYCTPWNIIDWVDNSNGFLDFCDYVQIANANEDPTWWHVENVTVTVMFDSVPPPYQEPIYLEWTGPLPPNAEEFDPIGVWHEVFPEYCQLWHCDLWEDTNQNGIVDFCDWFFFTDPFGEVVMMHVAGVATDIEVVREEPPPTSMVLDGPEFPPFEPVTDPRGPWHELWPTFCTNWNAIEWIDNGSGVLDHCDYLLLETPDEPDPTWWHVDYVTLTVMFDEIEGPYVPPLYMEWTGTVPPDPAQFDPIGPWHEVYPNYCIVWECVEWHDTNGTGVLDFCDWLCFLDPFTGELICMHVGALATDIRVVREDPPPPPTMVLDGPDFPPFEPIPDPRGPWHELWPVFCSPWECVDWIDNGNQVLDFCDYMKFLDSAGDESWWHVENVTLTVQFDVVEGPYDPPFYMEWMEPLPPDPLDFDPIGPWHMIYPDYCVTWHCHFWQDTNQNGIVDFCDWLCFDDPFTGQEVCMHVFELATDIEVVAERPPCPWDFDGDWVVGFQDLLALLAHWGQCTVDPCPWDVNGDNVVGFQDLLAVLAHWGPCP